MKETYKMPLTIDEQIEYLHNVKNIEYNIINKEEAKPILYEHTYINVITPFKHRFARKDKKGYIIRDENGNHIYDRLVEFSEYSDAYNNEREQYPTIYKNIQKFETVFNSVVSYEAIHNYEIDTYSSFLDFISVLRKNLMTMSLKKEYTYDACLNMGHELDRFPATMEKYDDIYIFMDRLSLSGIITVFRCLDPDLRSKIYKYLQQHNAVLGYMTFESFDEFLTRIVPIRNCISHFNSLEVLKMYLHIRTKTLRTSSDRKKYAKIIKKLSE